MSSQFGKTWWGQQWLQSLNNIDYNNRLPRGSSYARNGSVQSIEITENQIAAKVKGSKPKPYKVDIILPPFFDPELGKFIQALATKPVIISKLLNRQLDAEILQIAESIGLKVFPKQWTDFKMQCSCPDWAVPCKHLAAVIYKVSAEIDNNPFLVFGLHRVDLIKELEKHGVFVQAVSSEDVPLVQDLFIQADVKKPKTKTTFLEENAYQKIPYASLPNLQQPIVELLEASPVFYQNIGIFRDKYAAKINKVVKAAQRIVQGKDKLSSYLTNTIETAQIQFKSNESVSINDTYFSTIYINQKPFSFAHFVHEIENIPSSQTNQFQPSTAALHSCFYLAINLLAHGAVVPQIVRLPNKQFIIRWLPALLSKPVNKLVEQLETMLPPNIFVWQNATRQSEVNVDKAVNLLSVFLTAMVQTVNESIGENDIFLSLFFNKTSYAFNKPGEDALSGGIQAWLQKYYITQKQHQPSIIVEEGSGDNFIVNIGVKDNQQKTIELIKLKDILHLKKFELKRFDILQSLTQLNTLVNGLDEYINAKGETPIIMNSGEFAPFLMQIIPAIELLGIDILLPKSLQQLLKPKASVKVKAKVKGKTFLRLDELLDFEWQVAIGNTLMSEDEFKKLLKKSEGLIKYKQKYIYVNPQELEKLHKHFAGTKTLSAFQLLRTALSGDYFGSKIELTDDVKAIIKELTSVNEIPLPKGLQAQLRPYQQRGYSWMYRNAKIGFGSIIADDMGLGKTLQVITTLLKYKEDGLLDKEPALVVVPTGLLTNWENEIQKFAPVLQSKIYHGTGRKIEKKDKFDILITTYGVARMDAPKLKKMNWHTLIIDEAQNIKNQNTEQTKAIKSIGAKNFIAMSGTPVENRLSELWSIMDYSNRGLLGSLKEFSETFGNPIQLENDINAANKLKAITGPFMMRRLKSDRTIITDLPDKIEINSYAHLAKEQASLYTKTLHEAMKEIEGIETTDHKSLFVRQGIVLQMILALKQICNHPTQFLKNNHLDASLSGKLSLLFDTLDSIVENNEKVLLFTQFTEMGNLLKHFITEKYGEAPLFYHGGCNIKQRKEMVDTFQNNRAEKIFVLSLKAAGTGLNLTAANHVIHYDLWWNPAVEAQATDRAYRIGQKSNVMVHRFITKNTFEEKIDEMIQSKKALANMTVATGENWIGNLSNKELKELFSLG